MFSDMIGFLFYFKLSKCVPWCIWKMLHSTQTHYPCEWQHGQIKTDRGKVKNLRSILDEKTVDESRLVMGIMIEGIKRWGKQLNNISTLFFNVCQSLNKCCSPRGMLPAVVIVKWDALTFSVSILISPSCFFTLPGKTFRICLLLAKMNLLLSYLKAMDTSWATACRS